MNRHKNLSIRWKIFGYLALFIGMLILLLWLFQTVFLDSFYRSIKTASIKNTASQIAQNIDKDDISDRLINISRQNDICIRVIDENFNDLYNAEIMPNCFVHHMSHELLGKYCAQAEKNSGDYLEIFNVDELFKASRHQSRSATRSSMLPPFRRDNRSIIYVKFVTTTDGARQTIFLNAMLSPLNSTVDTLRIQLICITVIFIILAILLSFIMAKRISTPIEKINKSAKEFARGNYTAEFSGVGYREISELNDTLNYAANELSKVEHLRRELIANVSHDLRTPLTMITGYSEIMRDIPGENTAENVQIIIDEASRLSDLVTDLLDLSKLQAGAQELNGTVFNVTEDIRSIIKRYTKFTESNGYDISFIAESDVSVFADELKISQVIYNLINNAINYTGNDKAVTVRQSVCEKTVKIEVIDTGNGIAPEQLPYVWERYWRTKKDHKRAGIGTGLGLSIVKEILDLHGVNYGVISTVGKGSTFWFELNISK